MYRGIYKKNGYKCLNSECDNKTCRPNNFCKRCANLGPLNPNYTDGNRCKDKKFYCTVCDKEITYQSALYGSGKCKKCGSKEASKKMKGQKAWNKNIKNSTNKYWLGKSNKNIIVKHHIDSDKSNNEDSNILKIKQGLHISLHWKSYNYLVEIGLVNNYLKEFMIKHDTIFFIDDGKLVHHIDGNRENNNLDNLLFLESRSLHNKLHQEAYQYLVKIKKIREYINWFFKKKEIAVWFSSKGEMKT